MTCHDPLKGYLVPKPVSMRHPTKTPCPCELLSQLSKYQILTPPICNKSPLNNANEFFKAY